MTFLHKCVNMKVTGKLVLIQLYSFCSKFYDFENGRV